MTRIPVRLLVLLVVTVLLSSAQDSSDSNKFHQTCLTSYVEIKSSSIYSCPTTTLRTTTSPTTVYANGTQARAMAMLTVPRMLTESSDRNAELMIVLDQVLNLYTFTPGHLVTTLQFLQSTPSTDHLEAFGMGVIPNVTYDTNVPSTHVLVLHAEAKQTGQPYTRLLPLPRDLPITDPTIDLTENTWSTDWSTNDAAIRRQLAEHMYTHATIDHANATIAILDWNTLHNNFSDPILQSASFKFRVTDQNARSQFSGMPTGGRQIHAPIWVEPYQRLLTHIIAQPKSTPMGMQNAYVHVVYSLPVSLPNPTLSITPLTTRRVFDPRQVLVGMAYNRNTRSVFLALAQFNSSGPIVYELQSQTFATINAVDLANLAQSARNNKLLAEWDIYSLHVDEDRQMMILGLRQRSDNTQRMMRLDINPGATRTWHSALALDTQDASSGVAWFVDIGTGANVDNTQTVVQNGDPLFNVYSGQQASRDPVAFGRGNEYGSRTASLDPKQLKQVQEYAQHNLGYQVKPMQNNSHLLQQPMRFSDSVYSMQSKADTEENAVEERCQCVRNAGEYACCGRNKCDNPAYASKATSVIGGHYRLSGWRPLNAGDMFTTCVDMPQVSEFKTVNHAVVVVVDPMQTSQCTFAAQLHRGGRMFRLLPRANKAVASRMIFVLSPKLDIQGTLRISNTTASPLHQTTELPLDSTGLQIKLVPNYNSLGDEFGIDAYPGTAFGGRFKLEKHTRVAGQSKYTAFFEEFANNVQEGATLERSIVGMITNEYEAGTMVFALTNYESVNDFGSCRVRIESDFVDCSRPSEFAIRHRLCCPAGRYCFPQGPSGTNVELDCPLEGSCEGNRLMGVCSTGYMGFQCAQCAQGYYRLGDKCFQCSLEVSLLRVLLAIVAIAGLSLLWAKFGKNGKAISGLISVGLTFFQIVSIMVSLDVDWPDLMTQMFSFLSVFNLNLELLVAPECVSNDWSPIQDYFVYVSAPFMLFNSLFVTQMLARLLSKCLRVSVDTQQKMLSAAINIFVQVLSFGYIFLANQVLKVYDCTRTSSGALSTWNAYPQFVCYEGNVNLNSDTDVGYRTYTQATSISIFGVFTLVIGVPVVFLGVLRYYRKDLDDQRVYNRFGFLYNRFKEDTWYYELAVLLRKLITTVFVRVVYLRPVENPSLPIMAIMVVTLASMAFALWKRPFTSVQNNRVEVVGGLATLIVLATGLLVNEADLNETEELVMSVVSVVSVLGTVIMMIVSAVQIVRGEDEDEDMVSTVPRWIKVAQGTAGVLGTSALLAFVTTVEPDPNQGNASDETITRFWVTGMMGLGIIVLNGIYQGVKRQCFQKMCGCAYDRVETRQRDGGGKCCTCIECCSVCGCCGWCQEPVEEDAEMGKVEMDDIGKKGGDAGGKKGKVALQDAEVEKVQVEDRFGSVRAKKGSVRGKRGLKALE